MKFKNLSIIVILVLTLMSCAEKKSEYRHASGPIQGTMFNITYLWHSDLSHEIDSLLQRFNMSLSNYDVNSVISKINYNVSDTVDDLFLQMYRAASEVHANTGGAFDITVAPLANLWGFGWTGRNDTLLPDSAAIAAALTHVGMGKTSLKNGHVIKHDTAVMFISNAIAQGLSVDYVAAYFDGLGLTDYLVEIGGEVFCKGKNPQGEAWRIGIDKPVENSGYENRENELVVALTNKAIATSGNYRKFVENGNHRYGHSLNPHTGFPADNELLSVSVVANNCMAADAYATAFMVCGLNKSIQIIDSLNNIDAFFICTDNYNNVFTKCTNGFNSLIITTLEPTSDSVPQ